MELSGVRSSWETVETNSSFIRSIWVSMVTSRTESTPPVIRPDGSTMVVKLMETGIALPFDCRMSAAQRALKRSPSRKAALKDSKTEALRSLVSTRSSQYKV
ncbi:hypothetical protein D3C86_1804860 [compost metagenome]